MSIVRRIKREARNNPAKAALLAGLLGLAIYSWAPLVMGWLGTGDESAETASRSAELRDEVVQVGAMPQSPESDAVAAERPSWRELRRWQESSPWTAAIEMVQMRDPFRAATVNGEAVEESEESEAAPVTTPEQMVAGIALQLTGTIVGPRRRVALIDGQAYGEGDVIRVDHLGTTWELEIRRIEANRVTLGWQSIERELTVPKREPVGRIELVEHSG